MESGWQRIGERMALASWLSSEEGRRKERAREYGMPRSGIGLDAEARSASGKPRSAASSIKSPRGRKRAIAESGMRSRTTDQSASIESEQGGSEDISIRRAS
jgi:hypothetical protein